MSRLARVRRAARRDEAPALGLLALVVLELTTVEAPAGDRAAGLLVFGTMALAVAFRRRALLRTIAVVYGAGIASELAGVGPPDVSGPFLALLVLAFAAGQQAEPRRAWTALAAMTAGVLGVAVASGSGLLSDYVFPVGFVVVTWTAGRALQTRTRLAAELHEAAVRAEEERAGEAARAAAGERRRIAREMHDVVAHSVSVMVVQAGGARRILDRDPARAADAAALIERTGRLALAEMRLLLGVLHTEDGDASHRLAPQPTLDDLPSLVQRAREAGLPVALRVHGERRPLPAGAEVAVYRVAQEALTNAIKHATGAPAAVVLAWAGDALELTVADTGPAAGDAGLPGGGHGLTGMRERMRFHGGTVDAGPRPGGGFAVRARLPLPDAELAAA